MNAQRYPVYIPSKGRADTSLTIRLFLENELEFLVVVEEGEIDAYTKLVGREKLLVLPESGRGLVFARNFIKDHATTAGHARHWQFDDDIMTVRRMYRGFRIPADPRVILAAAEDFVDRYENVALASFNSHFFVPTSGTMAKAWPPFYLNARCYTIFLINNAIPNRFRGRYNEDTDMSLQVLADGWCTILFNAFLILTPTTMTHGGGQTGIYVDDGRLRMARELERRWPGVVSVKRRFKRPQHRVKGFWTKFDTPLKLRADAKMRTGVNEYGMRLMPVKKVQSIKLRALLGGKVKENESIVKKALSMKEKNACQIYVLSKARHDHAAVLKLLAKEKIAATVVVEPQDFDSYSAAWSKNFEVAQMDDNNQGIAYARNWTKAESLRRRETYHWQLDDNIKKFAYRPLGGKLVALHPALLLGAVERITLAYKNIVVAGPKYATFSHANKRELNINSMVSSCMLVDNSIALKWRSGVWEDSDYACQVLTAGYCTLLINTLLIEKPATMSTPGGCTDAEYSKGGKMQRIKQMQTYWPGWFRPKERKGIISPAPSRIWSTFQQQPILRNAKSK